MTALDDALARARAAIAPRVEPDALNADLAAGALVVDMRTAARRTRDGELPGACVIERNVLEWRLDPDGAHRIPEMDDPQRRVVLVCNEGYASSLAAAQLREIGVVNATDLAGGSWRGLPSRTRTGAQSAIVWRSGSIQTVTRSEVTRSSG